MSDWARDRDLSIVIPTYEREQVLIDTIAALVPLMKQDSEIVVVDQTLQHESGVQQQLEEWNGNGLIRWLRGSRPSIPGSMNRGAQEARGRILLFLDDDILPDPGLLERHRAAHEEHRGALIAGRVLQPWHPDGHDTDSFTKTKGEYKTDFMGGNFSIARELLMELGGFDENFKGAAYQYEREFADRLLQNGYTIWYEPSALIRHLHHTTGGTRSQGSHLTSWNPRHPVGAYYYLFVSPSVRWRVPKAVGRVFRSVITRHHLKKPWYIPVTLISEITGLLWALWLRLQGPALSLSKEPHEARAA